MNVWRVMLHGAVIDEAGNKIPKQRNWEKEEILLKYYLDNNVVAIGWPIDNQMSDVNSFEEYLNYANKKYNNDEGFKRSIPKFGTEISADDLIWIKSNDKYYIAKVAQDSKWRYSSDNEAKRCDACNQITNIIWKEIDEKLLLELKKIKLKNHWNGRTLQQITQTECIDFSKYAFNKTFGLDYFKTGYAMGTPFTEMLKLLKNNKNLILQGAPGTGKTYKTAELALRVIGAIGEDEQLNHAQIMERYNSYVNKGQIEFVTFHQSMDYEDFVEGLKPELIKSEEDDKCIGINYIEKPGVFQEICNRAQNNVQEDFDKDNLNKENFETAWMTLIDKLNENEKIKIPLITQGKSINLFLNKTGSGLSSKPLNQTESDYTNYYTKEQLLNVYRGEPGVNNGGHDNYRKAIIEYMKKECSLKEYIQRELSSKAPLKYVLIIDEINRGNVSKIFGELISLIEKDKRKPVGLPEDKTENIYHPLFAKLPYSKKSFSVPSNLFIIGTMNTTDRSVGSLDYALRRRFAFYTVESDRNLVVRERGENSEEVKLFDAVKKFLNDKNNILEMDFSDLMVGQSYFLTKTGEDIEEKWKYEIKPLLMEYYKDGIIQNSVADYESASNFISKYNANDKEEPQDKAQQVTTNNNASEDFSSGDKQ